MKSDIAILETRGGTGGDEAKLWADELLRLYTRYANNQGWKVYQIDESVIKIAGPQAYDKLRNEAGVHRVQRVPKTERYGRIHTSTASIAVLPEISEQEIHINQGDVQMEFYRASSHGGQNVQKVSTAVRLKHLPTGIVVNVQQERFQEANRVLAFDMLRAKLWERQELQKEETIAGYRSSIGRGMRSEKIRTFNFAQDRVTDHRINKSWHNIEAIVDGEIGQIIEKVSSL